MKVPFLKIFERISEEKSISAKIGPTAFAIKANLKQYVNFGCYGYVIIKGKVILKN